MTAETEGPEPQNAAWKMATPNLDDAKREPTQHPTKVDELKRLRDELDRKFVRGKMDARLIRQVLALVDDVLRLVR